jgi:solute carrier family 34 (sodium-dependent phosphate cotransporter)
LVSPSFLTSSHHKYARGHGTFAGATIHDIFNVLSVCILLPIEVVTHYLYYRTKAMLPEEQNKDGDSWEGPVKKLVAPLAQKVIISNKKVISEIAGNSSITCDSKYPVYCEDGIESYETCHVGLIGCDKETNECPIFFRDGATREDDQVSGGVALVLGIVVIIVCLVALVALLQKMLLQTSSRIIYKATDINPYLAIAVGAGITMLVQSSSITTSSLTPLAGLGVLRLEQMFPLTLVRIGTHL